MKNTNLTIADLKNEINTFRQILGDEKALNKCCLVTKRYFEASNIKEISIATFAEIVLIERSFAKMILVKLNSDIFNKKQGA
jgi:hypothetical protein